MITFLLIKSGERVWHPEGGRRSRLRAPVIKLSTLRHSACGAPVSWVDSAPHGSHRQPSWVVQKIVSGSPVGQAEMLLIAADIKLWRSKNRNTFQVTASSECSCPMRD